MKTALAIGLFFGWLASRFFEGDVYDQGYREGMIAGHIRGVVEGVDVGHLLGYDEGYRGCPDGGYGEGFFAGVHKGFECKMRQVDETTFEC